jgi:hypothetical protein
MYTNICLYMKVAYLSSIQLKLIDIFLNTFIQINTFIYIHISLSLSVHIHKYLIAYMYIYLYISIPESSIFIFHSIKTDPRSGPMNAYRYK